MSVVTCPFCGYQTHYGYRVCRGCHADITYGFVPDRDMPGDLWAGRLILIWAVLGLPACAVMCDALKIDQPISWLGFFFSTLPGFAIYWLAFVIKSYDLKGAVRFWR